MVAYKGDNTMNKQISNHKQILITASAFTGFGIINAIIFVILSCFNLAAVSTGPAFSILLVVLYFVTIWIPLGLTYLCKIKFNIALVVAYEIFIVLALVVGCLWNVYNYGDVYDKVVHFSSGILLSMLGYNLFIEQKQNKLTQLWIFIFAFSFAMMLGGVWEICEFSFDSVFGENAQHWFGFEGREVLKDTMIDMICDCSGAIIGGTSVALFEKRKAVAFQKATRFIVQCDINTENVFERN